VSATQIVNNNQGPRIVNCASIP